MLNLVKFNKDNFTKLEVSKIFLTKNENQPET